MSLMIFVNLIAFLLCYIDKRNAINNRYRIREYDFLFLSFIGGCFGMILGMYMFHHKTKKLKFKLVYFMIIMWIFILLYI